MRGYDRDWNKNTWEGLDGGKGKGKLYDFISIKNILKCGYGKSK